MLTETEKNEIRGLLFRGDPMPHLNRLRALHDPRYQETVDFMVSELKRTRDIPPRMGVCFWVNYSPRGTMIDHGPWEPGAPSYLWEVGYDKSVAHCSPPAPAPEPAAVKVEPPARRMSRMLP